MTSRSCNAPHFRMLSVAGGNVTKRIRCEPDPVIARIVAGWPRRFDARQARELGFTAEDSFEEIIRIHIADELGGRFRVRPAALGFPFSDISSREPEAGPHRPWKTGARFVRKAAAPS